MSTKTLKWIRNGLMAAAIVIGFLMWRALPDVIMNSAAFHLGNGESSSKNIALIMLFMPFISLLPRKGKKVIHTEDEKEREQKMEADKKEDAIYQVMISIAMFFVVIGVFGIALLQK